MTEEREEEDDRAEAAPSAPRVSIPPRPSIPPGTGPAHSGRLLFAFVWLALQATLVLTASRRADGAFGFRMFPESSSVMVVLYREIDGATANAPRQRIHVKDGAWRARGPDGIFRRVTWYDRIRSPHWTFDHDVAASYGAAAQLERLQAALDDLATHLPDDAETRRFSLDVTVRRNGREPVVHHLASPERRIPPAEWP